MNALLLAAVFFALARCRTRAHRYPAPAHTFGDHRDWIPLEASAELRNKKTREVISYGEFGRRAPGFYPVCMGRP